MKVFKGGYKIVSLLNIDITSDFTISGIYDDIKDSHGKPILVSEINIGGEKMNDAYTIVEKSGTSFILKVYGYTLTVASTDAVTVAEESQGVTSIGGVEGDITLGTGLTISDDGELSAETGSVKLYLHYYRYVLGSNTSFYVITTIDTLATNMAQFCKVMASATKFQYFSSGGTLMSGVSVLLTQATTTEIGSGLTVFGVPNEASSSVLKQDIGSFSTNAQNKVTEIQ